MPSSAFYSVPRDLPSFPTRRSSDLIARSRSSDLHGQFVRRVGLHKVARNCAGGRRSAGRVIATLVIQIADEVDDAQLAAGELVLSARSEEHTSELQSLRHLVCRLLLSTLSPEIYPLSLHDALPILSPAVVPAISMVNLSDGLVCTRLPETVLAAGEAPGE